MSPGYRGEAAHHHYPRAGAAGQAKLVDLRHDSLVEHLLVRQLDQAAVLDAGLVDVDKRPAEHEQIRLLLCRTGQKLRQRDVLQRILGRVPEKQKGSEVAPRVCQRARTHGPAATRACTPGPLAVRRSAAGSGMPSTTRDALTVFSPPRDCEQMTCKCRFDGSEQTDGACLPA